LTSQGVYTNLFTGQEKREIPFATHVSATVELAPTNEEFDVVVIDEIQMLCDPFRGFAWTRALLGIRCKEIHVCGGMEARELVSKIARDCGDEFEVREYRRFSELNVADKSLAISSNALGSYKNVRPGDCVVAFSRADIFAIKREIENSTKYKCCVVYGSLPPETRTDQARRFNNPDSGFDILVASDAIGMGLNLNIRRIIFNSLYKSNGEMIIKLDHSSVKQIAGRAGRRNSPFPEGEVTCRDPRDMEYLRKCMATEIAPITKAGLLPTPVHIELFSHTLQTYGLSKDYENLHKMLGRFSELATLQGDFFLCRQTPMRVIARILTDLNIPLRDKFTLCMAPVAVNNDRSMITLRKFAIKHAHGEVAGLNRSFFPKPAKSFDDLANLCSTHSDLELFLWLHNRFPGGNMMEQQSANVLKERAIEYINRGLKQTENLRFDHCYLKRDARLREMVKKRQKGEDQQDDIDDYIGRVDLADI
jgi:ATP-dependent RNA helicase SUPV3L1/SUV3